MANADPNTDPNRTEIITPMDNNDLRFFDERPELKGLISESYGARPPLTDKDWGKKFGGFSLEARARFAAEGRANRRASQAWRNN